MGDPDPIKVILGFGMFIIWMLGNFWLAKRGYLGKSIQKYFNDDRRQ